MEGEGDRWDSGISGGEEFFFVEWEESMVWNWLFVVMVKRGRWMFGRGREGGLCVYIARIGTLVRCLVEILLDACSKMPFSTRSWTLFGCPFLVPYLRLYIPWGGINLLVPSIVSLLAIDPVIAYLSPLLFSSALYIPLPLLFRFTIFPASTMFYQCKLNVIFSFSSFVLPIVFPGWPEGGPLPYIQG